MNLKVFPYRYPGGEESMREATNMNLLVSYAQGRTGWSDLEITKKAKISVDKFRGIRTGKVTLTYAEARNLGAAMNVDPTIFAEVAMKIQSQKDIQVTAGPQRQLVSVH